jgi:predicted nucleotidyltransferase
MDFRVEKKERNKPEVMDKDFETARKFAKKLYSEFGNFISALVLFGSTARRAKKPEGDIDILIVIDDVRIKPTPEILETFKLITEKAIINISLKIHTQTMKLTSFWEYVRAGDPVAINILRDGIALIDTGFFDPLQALLDDGRIRPSREAIYNYFVMSYASLNRSRGHILTAMVDLYWSAIDAAHSALMSLGEIPPSPEFVSNIIRERMVKRKLIKAKYADIMDDLYKLSKKIIYREVKDISGKDYDKYKDKTVKFIKAMKKFIEQGNR